MGWTYQISAPHSVRTVARPADSQRATVPPAPLSPWFSPPADRPAMTDAIIGCPHQEGMDYEGEWCPVASFGTDEIALRGERVN